MELPRKGIVIRILIYGAALTFFGVGAIRKHMAEKEALEAAEAAQATEVREVNMDDLPTKQVTMPDGSTVDVLELTEEQFEARFGPVPESAAQAGTAGNEPAVADGPDPESAATDGANDERERSVEPIAEEKP